MEIVSVKNLRWNNSDKTSFDAVVEFEGIGAVPFTASPDDVEEHGRQIFADGVAGEYGPIFEYVAPPELTPEEKRELMPVITKRQLRLTLVRNGISLTQVEAAIAAMPDGLPKQEAEIEWADASEFRRLHPALLLVAQALSLSDLEVDALWEAAIAA